MNKLLLHWYKLWLCAMLPVALPLAIQAQEDDDKKEIFELSPFDIEASEDDGYMAQTTLAGSRIRTSIRDIGASLAIITQEYLEDTGATDGESLLANIGNVEVGGTLGNFANSKMGEPAPRKLGKIRSAHSVFVAWSAQSPREITSSRIFLLMLTTPLA